MGPVFFCSCTDCNCSATVLGRGLPWLTASPSTGELADSRGELEPPAAFPGPGPESPRLPPIHPMEPPGVLRSAIVVILAAGTAIGLLQLVYWLWRTLGRKRRLDLALNKRSFCGGRVSLACSFHLSLANGTAGQQAAPYRGRHRHRPRHKSSLASLPSGPAAPALFPAIGMTQHQHYRLSSSLSSLASLPRGRLGL